MMYHLKPFAVLLAIAATLSAAGNPAPAQGLRSDSKVKVQATGAQVGADGKQAVVVKLAIAKGWHIYANPVGHPDLASAQTQLKVGAKARALQIAYPPGKVVKDAAVGDYKVYDGDVTIRATIQRGPGDTGPLELSVMFQACDDKSCLLPATVKVTVP